MEEWSGLSGADEVGGAVGEAVVGSLPGGVVTFLLTDVEESTRQWQDSPDTMAGAIARHYEVIDHAVAEWRGSRPLEQGEGDSTVSVFVRPVDALEAAVAMQLGLATATPDLRVRIAVHTGEAQMRDETNYVGPTIIRCARLRGAAHGGQVLVSSTTAALVMEQLPVDTGLIDLGSYQLRDLATSERIWQLTHPALDRRFPPLLAAGQPRHNLPPVPDLIGRDRQVGDLRALVRDERIVTITGVGGVGKTSLAKAVAAASVESFSGGVWWVELASVTDPDRVAGAVLIAVGGNEVVGQRAEDVLTGHLRQTQSLVVIDNCEHLLDSVSAVAQLLVDGCPDVHLLTTGREPLGVAHETTWRTPSLSVPADGAEADDSSDAVALFVERARHVRPNFTLDSGNAAAVAQICRRLDGIPLAIELAAARVRALPVERLAADLDQRFRLLTGGSRTALPRQRTLLASVDWSYELLDEQERSVLRRLSAFMGGFTLDAAEAVCADERLDAYGVLDVLTRLCDKSLVQVDDGGDRYRLLETIRHYAIDRARTEGDLECSRDRHLEWAKDLVRKWDVDHTLPTNGLADAIANEHANLLAALEWSLQAEPAPDLLGPLALLWASRSMHREAREWGERVLDALPDGSQDWITAVAHYHLGEVVAGAGTHRLDRVEAALAAAEAAGDTWAVIRLLIARGLATMAPGPTGPRAQDDYALAIALATETGDEPAALLAIATSALGHVFSAEPAMAERDLAQLATQSLDGWLYSYVIAMCEVFLIQQGADLETLQALVTRYEPQLPPAPRTSLLLWLGAEFVARADVENLASVIARFPPESQQGGWLGLCSITKAGLACLVRDRAAAEAHARLAVAHGATAFALDWIVSAAAVVAVTAGCYPAAKEFLAHPVLVEPPPPSIAPAVHTARGLLALADGDHLSAEHHAFTAVEQTAGEPYVHQAVHPLEVLACTGEPERAARLAAAAQRIREEHGNRLRADIIEERLPVAVAEARSSLGPEFDALWAEGASLTLYEACAFVLRMRGERRRPDHGWASLTPTETEVVDLVAQGLTNPQIAQKLLVETSTVKTHLHHVFTKLGVTTRAQLAAEAVRRGEPA